MKHTKTFRLENSTIATIQLLSQREQTTNTDIVEKAIIYYSKVLNEKKRELMSYAGSIDGKTGDKLMKVIYEARSSSKPAPKL